MRWKTPFVSDQRFQSHTEEAARIAQHLTGEINPPPIQWVHVPYQDGIMDSSPHAPEGHYADEEVVIAHDTLEELLFLEESDAEDDILELTAASPSRLQQVLEDDMPLIQRTLLFTDEHPVRYSNIMLHVSR